MDNYFLGLDIGTGTIGWSVTDENYNVLRKKRDLNGVVLYDEAETAEDCRKYRTARRRLTRRKARISLLQNILSPAIMAKDENFLFRLKESAVNRNGYKKSILFMDSNYNDGDFYAEYPTIYHLRRALLSEDRLFDIRQVYLAIHHIIKYRGHFLWNGESCEFNDVNESLYNIQKYFEESNEFKSFSINLDNIENIKSVIKKKKQVNYGVNEKQTELFMLLNAGVESKTLCGALAGKTINVEKLFINVDYEDIENIDFSKDNIDEKLIELSSSISSEDFNIIVAIKEVRDWAQWEAILNGNASISYSMAEKYDKHKNDLKKLKQLLNEYFGREVYRNVFCKPNLKRSELDNKFAYYHYIGAYGFKGHVKKCVGSPSVLVSQKVFLNKLKELLQTKADSLSENELYKEVMRDICAENFLPKQVTKLNLAIPMQANLTELKKILAIQSKYHPIFNEVSDGLSIAEKIISIFKFKIPYYVGPLTATKESERSELAKRNKCFNWVIRSDDGKSKLYPWTVFQVVDKNATAERFIRRMTNKCTYLPQFDVLPKCSLLYSEYCVLNELNNIRVFNTPLSEEEKHELINDKFCQKKEVSKAAFINWLNKRGSFGKVCDEDISGFADDKKFLSGMRAYNDFKLIVDNVECNRYMIEDIIYWSTVFGKEKDMLHQKIIDNYPEITTEQWKRIKGLTYSGWGRLSAQFLGESKDGGVALCGIDTSTGETANVIDLLWKTSMNLQQIIYCSRWNFEKRIEDINKAEFSEECSYNNLVADLVCSPSVKRQVWTTIRVVNEIVSYMKHRPSKIFIEMARAKVPEKKGKRPLTRSQKLEKIIINNVALFEQYVLDDFAKVKGSDISTRMMLYFLQQGKCAYTKQPLEFSHLENYHIDHILPQAIIKDNSFDNLALVFSENNAEKSDALTLPSVIRENCKEWWLQMKKADMMSDKKFARLTRTEYSERDIEGFISRQLNETRYTSKLVAHLLEQLYYPEGNKNVKFVKANIVSTFRHEQGLKKVRDVNDFHHAHDAYLNVVVGNLLFTKFGNEINRNFATKLFYDAINNKKREQDIINTVISSDILVGAGIDGAKMRMYATSTKIQVVKRVSEGCGAFYEQNLTGKKEGLVPTKSSGEFSDTTKYGGYNGINPAYFSIIRHTKKGERLTSIIRIPLYRAAGIGDDLAKLKSYLEAPDIGRDAYVDVEIVRAKMPKYQLLNYNGSYVWIVGNAQGQVEFANANQLIVDKSMQSIISNICEANKLMTMDKKAKCVIDRSINFKENDLISAFNYLTSKISAKPFNLLYTPVCNVLINSDEIFKQLNSLDKLHIIQCLIELLSTGSKTVDLTKIVGGKKNMGRIRINANINSSDSIKIIDVSIAGLFRKVTPIIVK